MALNQQIRERLESMSERELDKLIFTLEKLVASTGDTIKRKGQAMNQEQDPFSDDAMQEPQSAPHVGYSSAEDFLSGGTPSAKFDHIGRVYQGMITAFEVTQQRDIKTGKPKFWNDGKPCECMVVTIQTQERDDAIDDDDGQRRLYINRPGGMYSALTSAIKLSKAKFSVGGTLAMKYTGDGTPTQRGYNAPKQYAARYTPAGATMAAAAPQPQRQPAAAPATGGLVQTAQRAAYAALQTAFPGMDKDALLKPWRAVIESVVKATGKDARTQFGVPEWEAVRQQIEAESAAPLPGDDTSEVPF